MPLPAPDAAVAAILASYDLTAPVATERAPSGLINATYIVTLQDGGRVVVQRVNPIFGVAVLGDIEAVTGHLAAAGIECPRLVRTRSGALGVHDDEGALWRVLTFLEGTVHERLETPALARSGGALVAAFHRATRDLEHEFRSVRLGVHDTAAHLARLERALGAAGPGDGELLRLGESILAEARGLPHLGDLPRRVTHGDLKASNLLFRDGSARAILDLDTFGRQALAYELGDAWRSWCNPRGEDTEATTFSEAMFAAAAEGYGEGARGLLAPEERDSLVPGLWTVCVELAARFGVDAFEDRYFGWDPRRFPSRREHNRVRAAGQLALARQVGAARGRAEQIVREALG